MYVSKVVKMLHNHLPGLNNRLWALNLKKGQFQASNWSLWLKQSQTKRESRECRFCHEGNETPLHLLPLLHDTRYWAGTSLNQRR